MDQELATIRFASLAALIRLAIMRTLLGAGQGLSAGEIGDATGLAASTLSSHLAQLLKAELVTRRKSGRALIYTAVPAALEELRGFLETLEKGGDDPRGLKLVPIALHSAGFIGLRGTLLKNNLPVDDLGGEGQRYFSLLDASGSAYGLGGLEGAGADQLLRSLIIYPEARGTGLGRALVRLLEARAREEGAQRVWLLTNDAEKYFRRLGYKTIDRAQAPKAITRTKQFAGLCPESAKLMRKELRT
jgi:N-acetylglutamate synthase-like GNAT family acetyltransferase/DNA-binding transcriptional ArsR family regulator